jgi:disulfide bond formation protein DsbB
MAAIPFVRPRLDLSVILFAIGLAAIVAAWGFELIGGYIPCELCLQQRTPYYVGLPLALIAILADVIGLPKWIARAALVLVAIAFVYNAGLGIYQSGAQWGYWQGPTACSGTGAGIPTSAKDLLSSLDTVKVVSCTDVTWRFLGLSFAGWNAIVSGVVALMAIIAAIVRPASPRQPYQPIDRQADFG